MIHVRLMALYTKARNSGLAVVNVNKGGLGRHKDRAVTGYKVIISEKRR